MKIKRTLLFTTRTTASCVLLGFIFVCFSAAEAFPAQLTLAWSPNIETDLAGYRLFCRQSGAGYDYGSPIWEGWVDPVPPGEERVDSQDPSCTIDLADGVSYCFVLRAFDTSGNESIDSDEACWTSPSNSPPVALAGPDQTVVEAATVALDASSSYDPDGSIESYGWRQTAGTPVNLSGSSTTTPSFTAPWVESQGETLEFELIVTDNEEATDTDTVQVIVENSDASPYLVGLLVKGPFTVDEGTMTNYTATATFNDQTTQPATTGSNWSEDSDAANITNDGVLVTSSVDSDQIVTVKAVYSFDGKTMEATRTVTILDVDGTNSPPVSPGLISPLPGDEDVPLIPELRVGAYADADGDAHHRTWWQISAGKNVDGSLEQPLVLEVDSSSHLTGLPVPELVLDEGRQYYWRARFCDRAGHWSQWSEIFSFSTVLLGDDVEPFNGIPDDQEVNENVDLDGAYGPDLEQLDIKSVNTVDGKGSIGLKAASGAVIERVLSVDPKTLVGGGQRPDEMPLGMIAFKLILPEIGDSAEVTIYFSEPAPEAAEWYKFDSVNGWRPHELRVVSAFSDDRRSVTLLLEDGDYGDADGVQNGVIVDPGGIGVSYASSGAEGSDGGGDGGGGGGCFISATLK